MKQAFLRPQFVEFIPEHLEEGVLYISQRYRTATHLCCCGCGEEVVTPLAPTDWSLQVVNGAATLHPSIGNWSFACRSHYWIRNGKVVWAASMSRQEIERGRMLDQRMRDAYFVGVNQQRDNTRTETARPSVVAPPEQLPVQQSVDWLSNAWKAFKRWLGLAE